MINKNKASAQPRHSSPHITPPPSPTADMPLPPSPTAAPQERSPPSRATTSTPTLNKLVAETPIPSALKELCSLDLGKSIPNFFPASTFVATNLKYLRSLKGLEMKVLDYAMTKETMDPAYVII